MTGATRERAAQRAHDNALRITAWGVSILAIIAVVAAAKFASAVIVPAVLAALLALTLTPLVAALERMRIPVTIAAAVVVCSGVIGTVGGAYSLAPSVEDWRARAPTIIRKVERQLRNIEREISKNIDQATAGNAKQITGDASPTDKVIESGQQLATDMLLGAPETLAGLLSASFLCFFFLAERAAMRRFALSLIGDWKTRLRLSRAMLDMRRSVGSYLLTVTTFNLLLGSASALAFWWLGIPSAPLWGVMVALLNFIGYLGPLIANLIIFVIGVATFSSLTEAIYPVLALSLLNIVEGQIITPMVIGQRAQVGPLSVFLALLFGAWLWGAPGALVATPLLIVSSSVWRRMRVFETAETVRRNTRRRPKAA